jgi:hypothetical protein
MQLTLWFWPRILAFVALHTSVARLILWLRFDGQLNARPTPCEIVPGYWATHRRLMQNRSIRGNSAQAKAAAQSTYSKVGLAHTGPVG